MDMAVKQAGQTFKVIEDPLDSKFEELGILLDVTSNHTYNRRKAKPIMQASNVFLCRLKR